MAELEIHHEGGHGHDDPLGKKVGVLAATFAVLLAVVTILSHRAHTDSVMKRTDENDKWSYFQAKKIKLHTSELGHDLLTLVGPKGDAIEKKAAEYENNAKKYDKEANEIQEQATKIHEQVEMTEKQAVRYDVGEGLLEIALVMSSLYFIAKKSIFPVVGVVSGLAGTVMGIYGFILPLLEVAKEAAK